MARNKLGLLAAEWDDHNSELSSHLAGLSPNFTASGRASVRPPLASARRPAQREVERRRQAAEEAEAEDEAAAKKRGRARAPRDDPTIKTLRGTPTHKGEGLAVCYT